MATKYSESYLYTMNPEYEKKIVECMLKAERLNQNDSKFDDIINEFKHRQMDNWMITIFQSKNCILLAPEVSLPTQFNVFVAKDVKSGNAKKVFMDVSRVIRYDNIAGKYKCVDIDQLIAQLIAATENFAFSDEKFRSVICTAKARTMSMQCWASLFTNIVDYLHKISLDKNLTARCKLMACMYFAENMSGIEDGYKKLRHAALSWTGLSDREEGIIEKYIETSDMPNPFKDIKTFISFVGHVLKIPTLSLDAFIERWLFIYGTKTAFATEYWPALAAMVTDAYVGCYINNQKTIEKICGPNMVMLAKEIIKTGGSLI